MLGGMWLSPCKSGTEFHAAYQESLSNPWRGLIRTLNSIQIRLACQDFVASGLFQGRDVITSCDPERGSPQRRWNGQRAPRHLANIIEKQNSYQRIHVYAHIVTTRLALPPAEVSILNMQRSGTVTDEPDPLYHVGASPDFSTKGLHLVSQEKYNTWVSGEKQQSRTRR